MGPRASGGPREYTKEKLENLVFSQNRISIDVTFPWEKCTFRLGAHRCTCKKIEEQMTKVNGKPYLRTKIALRVIVWLPFCDFFKKNLIPALVKVTIGQKRKRKDMREKVENRVMSQRRISLDVTFPKEKVHFFFWTPPMQLQF